MVNYIVSGIERSGTSMMMQMLLKGGAPVAFDRSRSPDEHNPKGYFELEGGKIIRRLMDGNFPFQEYGGQFVKITAYGLKFLPQGQYKVIFMLRDLDEVMDSMEKMSGTVDRKMDKPLFRKLITISLDIMRTRDDIDYIIVNHGDVITDPAREAERIRRFLGNEMLDVVSAAQAVDPTLYRNVKSEV